MFIKNMFKIKLKIRDFIAFLLYVKSNLFQPFTIIILAITLVFLLNDRSSITDWWSWFFLGVWTIFTALLVDSFSQYSKRKSFYDSSKELWMWFYVYSLFSISYNFLYGHLSKYNGKKIWLDSFKDLKEGDQFEFNKKNPFDNIFHMKYFDYKNIYKEFKDIDIFNKTLKVVIKKILKTPYPINAWTDNKKYLNFIDNFNVSTIDDIFDFIYNEDNKQNYYDEFVNRFSVMNKFDLDVVVPYYHLYETLRLIKFVKYQNWKDYKKDRKINGTLLQTKKNGEKIDKEYEDIKDDLIKSMSWLCYSCVKILNTDFDYIICEPNEYKDRYNYKK